MRTLHKTIINPTCAYLLIVFLLLPIMAQGQTAVGIISSIDGSVNVINRNARALDFGDDLILGEQIKVGKNSSLVLTYYVGCRQELFAANSVIQIGEKQSRIISGKLEKSVFFDCEVPSVVLGNKDSFKKAAFHFRGISAVKHDSGTNSPADEAIIKNKKSKSHRVDHNERYASDIKLKMWTAKEDNRYYRSGEHIIIYFVTDKDAYLNLNYFQADGHVVHLVPNLFEDKYRVEAGQIYVVGGNKSKLKLIVEHPYGEETISALISATPFDNNFKTIETIENSQVYQQKVTKLLANKKGVAEYALDIWSVP